MDFKLSIDLSTEAMSSPRAVSDALMVLAAKVAAIADAPGGTFTDDNGRGIIRNVEGTTVGLWEVA